jgi:ectoine hydroxylase-related dioxygenase (phytanoyl-CoA dioxygenase family)
MAPLLTEDHKRRFEADGFLILDKFIDAETVERLRARVEPLFKGEFETGLYPDEWNWQEGRDRPDRTRQICNGWKSDRTVASVVLSEQVGRCVAELSGWDGARICQDNVIWKPAGAKALGYHQDDSYSKWFTPSHMVTCWIALDDTTAAGGTIEYARGSHKWGVSPPIEKFHAPEDYQKEFRTAAERAGVKADIVPIEVPAGGCAFHHGGTWHGSDMNRADRPRRSVVAHCMDSESQFHPTNVSYIYNRYKRHGELAMDESFFPILWRKDGYRTRWLDRSFHPA